MDIRRALKNQHHAALAMFLQAVEACPASVWTSGEHPRAYWRIAYHALAYAHLYLYENLDSWQKWDRHQLDKTYLEGDDVPVTEPYSQQEMAGYVRLIDSEIDARIDALDLDDPHCGFTWYPNVSRVELLILSLRHLHGHLGQMHELLLAHGVDVEWLGQAKEPATA